MIFTQWIDKLCRHLSIVNDVTEQIGSDPENPLTKKVTNNLHDNR